jgi:multiple sugar transport system permease protein
MVTSTTQDKTRTEDLTPHKKRKQRGWSRYSSRTFYLFVAPWVLGFLLLTLIPLIYALLVSFTDFDGISSHWHWIGLQNYIELMQDSQMWTSLGRTVLFAVITVPLSVGGGLALAMLLNQRIRAVGVFRTIFYLPSVVPVVASAIMWKLIFDRDSGVLNAILERFGIPTITWLIDPTAFLALIIMMLWGLGGGMIISLAGLQGVPEELHEAASLDGANAWHRFLHVTLPLLTPVLFFQIVTSTITALQILIQPILLAQSGQAAAVIAPGQVPSSNYLYMVNVYQQFFGNQRFGYGSAMLWVLFLVIMLITLLVFRSSSMWVYYEVENEG